MKGLSLFVEIGRWAAALIVVVMLVSMFGGAPVSDADPAAVTEAVVETLDMTNMVKAENQMVKRLYGLNPADYPACTLYYPTTNMGAEELLVIQLHSSNQVEAVEAAIEARLQTQKNTFEGYGVEQFDLLSNHSVIEIQGNYVLFVVHSACDEAKEAFVDAL